MILPALRIPLSLLVLATLVTLISACGGGGRGSVTKTRAIAFANVVNLRDHDLRRMTRVDRGFEPKGVPPCGSCATHLTYSDEVVAVSSSRFSSSRGRQQSRSNFIAQVLPVEGVRSLVYVMREPDLAIRNVVAARSASAPACVGRLRVTEASGRLVGREPYKSKVTASSLPFPLLGVAGYGLRVSGTFAAGLFHQKTRPTYYEDTFGFAVGPAEIILHADDATRPFPSGLERRLLSLLYDRANAHELLIAG